ncbi:MAG: TetR/AcrR family transcriptional regulator [Spirochaetales bacterium]|nr:TetR/AcrR family transcriptional regulator [Spirochaetales bacterium]
MVRKEIKEQRVKGYFIQAAKEILKGEGLVCVSTRNVADRAGYSYATLYNYFKDIKDLVFECAKEFIDEVRDFVKNETVGLTAGIERIQVKLKAYLNYFIQYPGIFELFFLERVSSMGNNQKTVELIYTFLDKLCADDWNYCIEHGIVRADQLEFVSDHIRFISAGLLLFYINRRHPQEYGEFISLAQARIKEILDRYTISREDNPR